MPKKEQVPKKSGRSGVQAGALASTAQISTSSSDSEASRARTARENNDNNASGDGAVLVSHADVVELMATAADNAVFENVTGSSEVPPSTPKFRPKPVYCSELAGHPFAVQDLHGDGNCSNYQPVDTRSPANLPMDSGPSSPLSRMSTPSIQHLRSHTTRRTSRADGCAYLFSAHINLPPFLFADAPFIEEKQVMALKVVQRLMNGALVSAFERWRDALPGTENPTLDDLVTALEAPVSDEGTIPDSFQKVIGLDSSR